MKLTIHPPPSTDGDTPPLTITRGILSGCDSRRAVEWRVNIRMMGKWLVRGVYRLV